MELRAGYKMTEIGEIPMNWEVKKFTECATLKHGFQFREEHFSTDGIKVVKIGTLKYSGNLDFKNITYIPISDLGKFSNFLLYSGDILMALTGATLGKCSIVKTNEMLLQNYRVGNFFNTPICTKEYIYILLQSDFIQKTFKKLVNEAAQPNIGKGDFDKFIIPIPSSLKEQTFIAITLSDAGNLIGGLEKIIAKKRNIKQGVMQKLLQPAASWETKTLKELARYRRGSFPQPYGLDKWYDDINGFPFVQVYDVDDNFKLKSETKRRISKEAQDMSVYIAKGSIIITLQGSIGRIAITQYDAYVDRTLLFFESFIVPFEKKFFLLSIFNLFEKEKEKAPGGIIKTITKEALSRFTISYPKIEEQTRIANILSDMDAEIEGLESKLEKYKNIKQGMMQNLLTGKIRLV